MHEDMRALLNAYLDGELHGTRLLEMELHLASCEACRNELKELHLVSDLLQAAPTPEFMPAERFVSNLTLQPAAPYPARPASKARFPGLVAGTGWVAGGLVLCPDGIHTLRRGHCRANNRPARAGCHLAGRRAGNGLVRGRDQPVRRTGWRGSSRRSPC